MSKVLVVDEAHAVVSEVVRVGDFVIDATAGNGFDTEFLCQIVGPAGTVLGVDIQQSAIERTRRRLNEKGLADRAILVQADHSMLDKYIAEYSPGRLPAAIMFNLGYLPGGDKAVVTQPESTSVALEAAARSIRAGGIVSIVVYRGHEGAKAEARAVEAWIGGLSNDTFTTWSLGKDGVPAHRPYVSFVKKRDESAAPGRTG